MALPGIPGPGIAVAILGLIILAEHFHWARRLLAYFKQKAERLKQRLRK